MGFIVGLLSGVIIGAVGAIYYSMKSGRDLREVADEVAAQVRSEMEKRDLDTLATQVGQRVAEVQSQVEQVISQARNGS